jgi:hypothetical protein
MSCGCQQSPCACPATPPLTKCDLYVPGSKNVWVERGNGPSDASALGVCMLDTMNDAQVIYAIERDEQAREDLLKITSDPHLLELAKTVPRLPIVEETDMEQAQINQPNNPGSIPFYSIFRGQPPFAQ